MKKPEPLNFDEGVILFVVTYELLALSTLMCPLARNKMKSNAERWPMIAKKWRETVDILYEKFKADGRLETTRNWTSSEAMWEWWTGSGGGYDDEPEECQGLSLFSDEDDGI